MPTRGKDKIRFIGSFLEDNPECRPYEQPPENLKGWTASVRTLAAMCLERKIN